MSFSRTLFAAMLGHAERPAMQLDDETVSHAQAVAQAGTIATHLAAAGIGPGDRVGIAVSNVLEAALCILACWRLSATPSVIDFRTPRPVRARLAADFGLAALLESRSPPGVEVYPALAFAPAWRIEAAGTSPDLDAIDCTHPAFLMLSSGTTGAPKGYLQAHEVLGRRLASYINVADDSAPRFLTPMTLAFSATRQHVMNYLVRGGVINFFPLLYTPSELIEGLLAFRATASALPPPIVARLVREVGERDTPLFPGMKVLDSIGGPALPEDKLSAYRNLSPAYSIKYASSLTGRISQLAGADVLARPESAGRVAPGVRVEILDAEGRALPPGAPGVIKAWTHTMASGVVSAGRGHHVDPAVMGEGWGIPGDIGSLDEEGFLTILDRQEDMIVRGGVNVAPQEIEALIRAHPEVEDVAVAGIPDAALGQEIAAFVVAGAALAEPALRAFLTANLIADRRPRHIRLVRALPYNANGKLVRRSLVESLVAELAAARDRIS